MKEVADMKHYKMPYHKLYRITCIIFLIGIVMILWSCKLNIRNIDSMIEDCYNSNDTIIQLSDLFPEEWDTVYFFGPCSAEDIAKRTGPEIYRFWCDIGDKMIIPNNNKEYVYYKEWDMYYGQDIEGAVFRINSDSLIIAIPRREATFLIRKRDEKSFWVIHQ